MPRVVSVSGCAACALLSVVVGVTAVTAVRFGDTGGPPLVFSAGFTSDAVLQATGPTVYGLVDGQYAASAKVTVTVRGTTPGGTPLTPYSVDAMVRPPSKSALPGAGTW